MADTSMELLTGCRQHILIVRGQFYKFQIHFVIFLYLPVHVLSMSELIASMVRQIKIYCLLQVFFTQILIPFNYISVLPCLFCLKKTENFAYLSSYSVSISSPCQWYHNSVCPTQAEQLGDGSGPGEHCRMHPPYTCHTPPHGPVEAVRQQVWEA